VTYAEKQREYRAKKLARFEEFIVDLNFIAADGLSALNGGEKTKAEEAFRRIITKAVKARPDKLVAR